MRYQIPIPRKVPFEGATRTYPQTDALPFQISQPDMRRFAVARNAYRWIVEAPPQTFQPAPQTFIFPVSQPLFIPAFLQRLRYVVPVPILIFVPPISRLAPHADVIRYYAYKGTPRPYMPIAYLRQVNVYSTIVDPSTEPKRNTITESPSQIPPYNE